MSSPYLLAIASLPADGVAQLREEQFRRRARRDIVSSCRRLALMIALIIAGTSALSPAHAQAPGNFDPIATAKLRAGEIAREIAGSERDPSVPEPSRDDIFNTGLLLQAGLRALLPVQERQGVALPGTPSPKDPPELTMTQENYRAVFESGGQA